ncbi:MFS transporter [Amycolatopsis suaedae]|uniref:MFS transporter n=1 Tax=Amycolatopsis suaedae TaxID=2510978 RepID=UPI001F0FAEBC|nr:MFS transporter [Amycolatopsis suaedae]
MVDVGHRRIGFIAPLRVGEFRALWAAELVSVAGDQVARVALSLLVYAQTASAALTALTYGLTFVPSVLGGFLLSGIADRFPRRRVLVVIDVLRAGLAAAMAVPGMPLPVLWGCVAVLSLAAGPYRAAHMAMLPQLLGPEVYPAGLALRQFTSQAANLAGFAGGGLLLALLDPHVGMLLNAATFAVSVVVVMVWVRPRPVPAEDEPRERADRSGPAGPRLAVLYGLVCLIGLYVVPEGLAAPYAGQLGYAAVGVGVLLAAEPAGSALGAWLSSRSRAAPTPVRAGLIAAAGGAVLAVCAFQPGLVWSAVLWALSGVLSTAYLLQTQTMVAAVVPANRHGRVMGRMAGCLYCSQGVAVLLGGVVAEAVGPFLAVAASGLLAVALALLLVLGWLGARSRLRPGSEPGISRHDHHSLPDIGRTSSQQTDWAPL